VSKLHAIQQVANGWCGSSVTNFIKANENVQINQGFRLHHYIKYGFHCRHVHDARDYVIMLVEIPNPKCNLNRPRNEETKGRN
jgi:hypothetical protein